jgi:hypothetical protein
MTSNTINNDPLKVKSVFYIGSIAAVLQLVTILGYSIALGMLGPKPTGAAAYFAVYQESPLEMVLRGDFLLMVLIGLYLGTFPALYITLRRLSPVYSALATLFTIISVTMTFSGEATFALLHLAEQYATATSETVQAQLVAAGEAVIAAGMWHSSASYMNGILLQGSGLMISIIMLRSKDFHKVTAYAGIVANGLDLIQHVIHPFAPEISGILTQVMGLGYFVWFPMLAWDFFRLAKIHHQEEKSA